MTELYCHAGLLVRFWRGDFYSTGISQMHFTDGDDCLAKQYKLPI